MPHRVNKRFLIILTVVLTVIVLAFAGVGIVSSYLLHRNPKNYSAAGDAAAQSGNWELAAGNYGRAISLGRADPDLYIRNGVALEHCVGANPDCLKQAENSYQNALVVDPANISAARHLMEMQIQLAEVAPSAPTFGKLRDSAQRVAQLDPSDQRAVAYQHVGTILLSERPSGPSGRSLSDDLDALAKFVRQDPSDSNLSYYYAREAAARFVGPEGSQHGRRRSFGAGRRRTVRRWPGGKGRRRGIELVRLDVLCAPAAVRSPRSGSVRGKG